MSPFQTPLSICHPAEFETADLPASYRLFGESEVAAMLGQKSLANGVELAHLFAA
jgi:hypothetical protein